MEELLPFVARLATDSIVRTKNTDWLFFRHARSFERCPLRFASGFPLVYENLKVVHGIPELAKMDRLLFEVLLKGSLPEPHILRVFRDESDVVLQSFNGLLLLLTLRREDSDHGRLVVHRAF